MATTYLTRTFSSPTDRKIFTWSAWVKRQNLVSDHTNALFGAYLNSSVRSVFRFNAHKLNFQDTEGSVEIRTNRLFRDVNAWYHIVLAVDTTQATSSDRVKLYVNGEQETSLDRTDYPAQNSIFLMGGADIHYINARNSSGSVDSIADMSYSHIHFTDGTAYDASYFGSTDSTTGEWKIKTSPSVTYGNNGFFILKDGNSVTDQSGNSNNWTVGGGTLTKTEDNPSNVFATLNPLAGTAIGSYTNGNNRVVGVSTSWTTAPSTLAVSSGKFYCEAKAQHTSLMVGILDIDQMITNNFQGTKSNGWGYEVTGTLWNNGNPTTSWGSTYTTGDIIGIGMDLDNNKLYFSKNGTWQNSANPSAGTGGISITADKTYYFAMSPVDSTSSVIEANFGNGYFGTTAVSSAGTNASGIGIFEYDVPTGFTALSTKGLNL